MLSWLQLRDSSRRPPSIPQSLLLPSKVFILSEFNFREAFRGETSDSGQSRNAGIPYGIEFAEKHPVLACVDESGGVRLFSSTPSTHSPTSSSCIHERASSAESEGGGRRSREALKVLCGWSAHSNAIFDCCFLKNDELIATASGDQTISLWDLGRVSGASRSLSLSPHHSPFLSLKGHAGSVKTVQGSPSNPFVLASGGRDGSVILWDTRVAGALVSQIHCAHAPRDIEGARGRGGDRKRGRKAQQKASTSCSVTAVLFLLDGQMLCSAGVADGLVKLWDVRKFSSSHDPWERIGSHSAPMSPYERGRNQSACSAVPVGSLTTSKMHFSGDGEEERRREEKRRPFAITSLSQDVKGAFLLAPSTDHSIHLFSSSAFSRPLCPSPPFATFRSPSLRFSSLYIKSCISPDGEHILSGSGNNRIYLWKRNSPSLPPFELGHQYTGEVTSVKWDTLHENAFASCSDDGTVHVWRIEEFVALFPKRKGLSPVLPRSISRQREINEEEEEALSEETREKAWEGEREEKRGFGLTLRRERAAPSSRVYAPPPSYLFSPNEQNECEEEKVEGRSNEGKFIDGAKCRKKQKQSKIDSYFIFHS